MKLLDKAKNIFKPSIAKRGAAVISNQPYGDDWVSAVLKAYFEVNKTLYTFLGCAIPRHDPFELLAYVDCNGYHSAALHLKVATTVGVGYEASPALKDAINRANFRQSFQQILNEWALDMETFGTAYVQVVNIAGRIAFYRLPSALTRVRLPETNGSPLQYLQFTYTAPDRAKMGFGAQVLDRFEPGMQQGVRQMTLGSIVGDPFYGEPEYISVKKLLKLNTSIINYAEKFFDNSLMQDMAIILEGAELDDTEQTKIKQYISSNFRGNDNAHKILFLTVNQGEKVIFHEFNKELLSDSFSDFRKDNRDEIVAGHRVPPRMVSVLSAGSLGGTGEVEGQLKVYKQAFNDPRQKLYEEQWRQLFHDLGLPDADSFTLTPIDVTAGSTDMTTLVQGLTAGIINLQQAQEQWNTEKRDKPTSRDELIKQLRDYRKELRNGQA
jgi:hypothetical protein